MTQPPDESPDFLAKPVSPSGDQSPRRDQTPPPPSYGEPTSPYVAQPPPGAIPGQPAYTPYGPTPGLPGYPFARAHNGANVAMGLGIASVVCAIGTFLCCVTAPGVLCGPFAIALGVRARTEMSQNPGAYNNEGAAMTGLVTGVIGTVLGLAMIGLAVFFFGFVFSFS